MTAPTRTTRRADARPLVLAAVVVVVAGLAVGALIFIATNARQPTKLAPFPAGLERSLKAQVQEGGPVLYPDPFGGHRSVWFAIEDNRLVALASHLWQRDNCTVRWRGSVNRFVDCQGNRLTSAELPRYATSVPTTGSAKGETLVDVRTLLAPAALTDTSTSSTR